MNRAMKDSGIEWIGEIPEKWSSYKLKYIGNYINGYAFKPEDWGASGKPIIRIQDLTKSNNNPNYYSGDLDNKYLIKRGDILVSWAATLNAFIWDKDEGWLNQHIFKAIPNSSIVYFDYFFWLIKIAMENMNNDNKHGIVMQHVTLDVFNNFVVPIPSMPEQQKIADFLDEKCSHIDSVLEKTRASIEEYKQLKQSVITQAVTKGIRPNRPMKDSGIEWIGQIPEDWNTKRLRFLGSCQNGISKGAEFFGTGYPFVSYSNVYKNMELPQTTELIESTEVERSLYSVQEGDIFFTRTSETIEEIGYTSICTKTIPNATFAGFLIRFRPFKESSLCTKYAKYYFRSELPRIFFVKEMNLVTRASLGQGLLKRLPVLLPSYNEQEEIANYLDTKCSEIDKLINKKEQLIEELETYKKSLIYEYVTGKKEVC